jgi:hypothetical protein
MGLWWDNDANDQNTRILWKWANASKLFFEGRAEHKPLVVGERMSKRERAGRSRRLAETFEGVSHANDRDGYGLLRPFGTNRTGGEWWRIHKRKAS